MLPENAPVVESIVNAVLKECRKEQPDYKLKALPALATILHALEVDRFSDFFSIVKEYFTEVFSLFLLLIDFNQLADFN